MFKNKVAVLEGRLFSSQSELFESCLNCSDCLDERRHSEKTTSCMDIGHVNWLT